jgi:hypothetical protein
MKQDGKHLKFNMEQTKIHDFLCSAHFEEIDRKLQKLMESFVQAMQCHKY